MSFIDLKAILARQSARRTVRETDVAYARARPFVVAVDVGGDQIMSDIDALLAEVERLRRICEATNPCPNCGTLHLVRRTIRDVLSDPRFSNEAKARLARWAAEADTPTPEPVVNQPHHP